MVNGMDEVRRPLLAKHDAPVVAIALDAAGQRGVSVGSDGTVMLWDTRKEGGEDGSLRLWRVSNGECISTVEWKAAPTALAMAGRNQLVVGDASGRVELVSMPEQ